MISEAVESKVIPAERLLIANPSGRYQSLADSR